MKKSATLVALGVATLSLTGTAQAAVARSAAPALTGARSDPFPGMTFTSGPDAEQNGDAGTMLQTLPEPPAGAEPQATVDPQAMATAAASCNAGKQCMWTGGSYQGPARWLTAGHSGTYWNWAEPKCATSGNPSGNWKNCASSLRNSNLAYGFTVFNDSGSAQPGSYKSVPTNTGRPDLGAFNNNIERSVGVGV